MNRRIRVALSAPRAHYARIDLLARTGAVGDDDTLLAVERAAEGSADRLRLQEGLTAREFALLQLVCGDCAGLAVVLADLAAIVPPRCPQVFLRDHCLVDFLCALPADNTLLAWADATGISYSTLARWRGLVRDGLDEWYTTACERAEWLLALGVPA